MIETQHGVAEKERRERREKGRPAPRQISAAEQRHGIDRREVRRVRNEAERGGGRNCAEECDQACHRQSNNRLDRNLTARLARRTTRVPPTSASSAGAVQREADANPALCPQL